MKAIKMFLTFALIALLSSSCETAPKWQKGALAGGVLGAGAGAVIGHQTDHAAEGAVIGGAVGALTGGLIGSQLDKQQAELSKVAEVERAGESELVVTLREKVLFNIDEYSLKPGAANNLNRVADILIRYPEFDIFVEGHTDSTGKENYNQWLSEKRAETVAEFIISRGVDTARVQIIGYGEIRPVATNETAEGRQQNRRVELHITPGQA